MSRTPLPTCKKCGESLTFSVDNLKKQLNKSERDEDSIRQAFQHIARNDDIKVGTGIDFRLDCNCTEAEYTIFMTVEIDAIEITYMTEPVTQVENLYMSESTQELKQTLGRTQ